MKSTSERQIETLREDIAAADRKMTDSLSLVAPRISVCEQKLEQMKSTSEIQIETLLGGIAAVDRKIADSLSPLARRVSVCEQQLKSHSPVLVPSPTPLPDLPDSPPAPKPAKKSWFSRSKRSPSPVPAPIPVPSYSAPLPGAELKFLLLGDFAVGKTSILQRYIGDQFRHHDATSGVTHDTKTIEIHNRKVKLVLIDNIPAQDQWRSIATLSFRGADGVLLVYDITNYTTFQSIQTWLIDLRNNALRHTAILLIGNKADHGASRAVSFEKASKFAEREGLILIETSAKYGTNISEAFELLTTEVLGR
jgi:small GTP-binding protein